mmetsp:Transcript_7848/g.13253  ORF Transcript_7848/g.13253 Transcript_7848/m.13253 type:complete len:577 (+) Transcript_7848:58-1788(+)
MRSTITDRQSYRKAHETYGQLHDLLGNLSAKLTDVSKDVDKEFLSSYRVHMLSIQTEIKNLREDVDKGVQALKSDNTVAKLETEVNWFVEECTRLRLHFTTMENDCKQMQSRYKAMMDQKQYMNDQLKAILKRNRVLEAEIEYALQHNQKNKQTEMEQEFAAFNAEQQLRKAEEEDLQTRLEQAAMDQEGQSSDDERRRSFYHNHLVRESEKSPLSTANFVPSPSRRQSTASRGGSRTSSRGGAGARLDDVAASSRSPSRAGSRPLTRNGGDSMGNHHLDVSEDNTQPPPAGKSERSKSTGTRAVSTGRDGRGGGFDSSSDALVNDLQGAEDVLPMLTGAGSEDVRPIQQQQQQQQPSLSRKQSQQGVQLSASFKMKQREKQMKRQRSKMDLEYFLKHKSPGEAALERAIAEVYEEVRARRIQAAKRGSVKRFPVNFMGKEKGGGNSSVTATAARNVEKLNRRNVQRAPSPPGRTNSENDAASIVSDSDLRSLLSGDDQDARGKRAAGATAGDGGNVLAEEEVDLLRQSLVRFTGGISGLGVQQLSDNDKFSCIVKYLLQPDRFREVVTRLRETIQ